MSSPKREEKIYGAVTTEDHITFTGFCKKIYSEEKFDIDVYIDEEKVDTIKADKTIENELNIYDTDGFCFEYTIHEEIIGEKHKIEFKDNNNKLQNSKLNTLEKTNPRFNEYLFLKSLSDMKKISIQKKQFNQNNIGFLITETNLKNDYFIKYINKLNKELPNNKIIAYYLDDKISRIEKDLTHLKSKIIFKQINSVSEIINDVFIFLFLGDELNLKLFATIKELITYQFLDFELTDSIIDYENRHRKHYDIFVQNPEKFGFTHEDLKTNQNSFFCTIFNKFISNKDELFYKDDSYQTIYFKRVKLLFTNKDFDTYFNKIRRKLQELSKIKQGKK